MRVPEDREPVGDPERAVVVLLEDIAATANAADLRFAAADILALDECRRGAAAARRIARGRTRSWAWAAAIAILVVALVVGFRVASGGAPQRVGPVSEPTSAGRAAIVEDGVLSVVDLSTGASTVLARGPYSAVLGSAINTPAFSPDGKWVAYLETVGASSSLYVEPASGGKASVVTGVSDFAWSPAADELAVSLRDEVELVTPAGTVLRHWNLCDAGEEVFSPGGTQIAVGSVTGAVSGPTPVAPTAHLVVLSVAGRPRTLTSFHLACVRPAGWTANGSYVLAWQDPQCSASIAADGLALYAVNPSSGRLVSLGRTLPYSSWVVPTTGSTVLVDRGTVRVAADQKGLFSCDAATGICSRLSAPADVSTIDPAFAPSTGTLYEVRVRQSDAYDDFLPQGSIWSVQGVDGRARRMAPAGTDVADPIPTANGTMLVFVRMTGPSSATVNLLTIRTGTVKLVASVDNADYYGEFQASRVLGFWQTRS